MRFIKRRYIIMLILIIVGGLVAFFLLTPHTSINKELSDRAKEYIKTQNNSTLVFSNVNLGDNQAVRSYEQVNLVNCFKLNIPYTVTDTVDDGVCQRRYVTKNPHGLVAVYKHLSPLKKYEEDSGINYRRLHPELYNETAMTWRNRRFLLYKKKDPQVYEKSAFYLGEGIFAGLTLQVDTDQNLDTKFMQMFQSFDFTNYIPVTPTPFPTVTPPISNSLPGIGISRVATSSAQ